MERCTRTWRRGSKKREEEGIPASSLSLPGFFLFYNTLILYCRFVYLADFRRRFLALLSYQFRSYSPSLALSILKNKGAKEGEKGLLEFSFRLLFFVVVFDGHTILIVHT